MPPNGVPASSNIALQQAAIGIFRPSRVCASVSPMTGLRVFMQLLIVQLAVPLTAAPSAFLRFAVAATAPIDRVDIVRSGQVVIVLPGEGRTDWSERLKLPPFERGEYVYVRVLQVDGGVAWASPVYVGAPNRPKSTRPG